jgi:selenocysteine-specific elongation factor
MVKVDGRAARPGFAPSLDPEQKDARDRILAVFEEAGYAPPRVDQLADLAPGPDLLYDILALVEAEGQLVRIEHDLFMDRRHLDGLVQDVRGRFHGRTDVSPAEFRELVGTSRRHLIPILEHLDRTGVTVRVGEGRAVPPPVKDP